MKTKTSAMLSMIVLFGLMLSSCSSNDTGFVSRRRATPERIEETKETQRAKEEGERKKTEAQIKEGERNAKEIKKTTDSSSNIPGSGGPSQFLNPRGPNSNGSNPSGFPPGGPNQSLNPRPSSSRSSSSNKLPPSPPQRQQYSTTRRTGTSTGAGMGDTDTGDRGAFSPSSSSSSSSLPSAPPLIELRKCNIRLYTDGKTYCSYKTENSSKFALVAPKYGGGGWRLPANYFDKLPVGSFYIRVGKVIDQTNKIHVEIIRKKEGDTRNPAIKKAKFIRSKPHDNSNDEWTPDSDGFRAGT
ncbi:hypothetical protein AGMMS49593_10310 [Endomicrobiia bacterium]|nr:hypothetical protein AGMMS49593_10310 [Endomicrobiia bacterium]